ncbi:nuclear cap-binding protein subunit 3 [Lingula anatina]|uniref:Nuclear cap-binding protein subunit 3 n=1 Tax=Lingula anatina TaxID=7574 RepID=A0A1S3J6D1_LINAN|nr:nuclear cap-binding protein subunit 3 [Lingula anatina]|eukprot:XP_013405399.1 nuclear cap-binding protein subunit 3 [Lingula anatina]
MQRVRHYSLKMAALGEELPNLKICIDNTDTISDDGNIEIDADVDTVENLEEGELENDKEDVEVNVSLGNVGTQAFGEPRKYENKAGPFVTGMDITSPEFQQKKVERAKRFGISDTPALEKLDLQALYKSLGLTEESLTKGERGIRPDAVHLRGVNELNTQDIFKYFQQYGPGFIEWIDDASCNVVWQDPVTAARAMAHLSICYEDFQKLYEIQNPNKEGKMHKVESKFAEKEKEAQKIIDEDEDDNLDLESSDEENDKDKEEKMEVETANESTQDEQETKENEAPLGENESEKEDSSKYEDALNKMTPGERKRLLDKYPHFKSIRLPPGKWRIGELCPKAKCLYLRYATKADKKLPGAERKSKYYVKYGNPNYGGARGLLSNSRKRKLRTEQRREEINEVRQSLQTLSKGDKPQESMEDEALFDMLFGDGDDIRKIERPHMDRKDLGLKNKRDIWAGGGDARGQDVISYTHRKTMGEEGDGDGQVIEEEENVSDEELERLLAPPKKRSMRMYADDLEEQMSAKEKTRLSSNITDARDRIKARKSGIQNTDKITDRIGLRDRIGITDRIGTAVGGSDLRNKLKNRRQDKHFIDSEPSLTIEVSQEDYFEDYEDDDF